MEEAMSARILALAPLVAVAVLLVIRLTPDALAQHATSITTDQSVYQVGDQIEVCYTAPTPNAPIQILGIINEGQAITTLYSGPAAGRSGCLDFSALFPSPLSCVQIKVFDGAGSTIGRDDTCFEVQ
jgi:hypothetical protein